MRHEPPASGSLWQSAWQQQRTSCVLQMVDDIQLTGDRGPLFPGSSLGSLRISSNSYRIPPRRSIPSARASPQFHPSRRPTPARREIFSLRDKRRHSLRPPARAGISMNLSTGRSGCREASALTRRPFMCLTPETRSTRPRIFRIPRSAHLGGGHRDFQSGCDGDGLSSFGGRGR
jgi:hypothetical protein